MENFIVFTLTLFGAPTSWNWWRWRFNKSCDGRTLSTMPQMKRDAENDMIFGQILDTPQLIYVWYDFWLVMLIVKIAWVSCRWFSSRSDSWGKKVCRGWVKDICGGGEDCGGGGDDSDEGGVHFHLSGEQGVRWWCGSLLTSSLASSMSASSYQHLVVSILLPPSA